MQWCAAIAASRSNPLIHECPSNKFIYPWSTTKRRVIGLCRCIWICVYCCRLLYYVIGRRRNRRGRRSRFVHGSNERVNVIMYNRLLFLLLGSSATYDLQDGRRTENIMLRHWIRLGVCGHFFHCGYINTPPPPTGSLCLFPLFTHTPTTTHLNLPNLTSLLVI